MNVHINFYIASGELCDTLSSISDGSISYTPPRHVSATLPAGKHYVGTIAIYSCCPGYQVRVNSHLTRVCNENMVWNGMEPSCGEFIHKCMQ